MPSNKSILKLPELGSFNICLCVVLISFFVKEREHPPEIYIYSVHIVALATFYAFVRYAWFLFREYNDFAEEKLRSFFISGCGALCAVASVLRQSEAVRQYDLVANLGLFTVIPGLAFVTSYLAMSGVARVARQVRASR